MILYKKLLVAGLLLCSMGFVTSNAQLTYNTAQPKSIEYAKDFNYDKVRISNIPKLLNTDEVAYKNGFYQIGYALNADLNISNSGEWNILEDGTKIWMLQIKTEGSQGLMLYFDAFQLPEGSELFIYSEDKSFVIGPLNENTNVDQSNYSAGIVPGETVMIEYIQPKEVTEKPVLELNEIGYIFRNISKAWNDESGTCEVNINCPEGSDWQDEKQGIVKIISREGVYIGLCTGSLVNNQREDGTPYILTACHCGETSTAEEFNQWQFYFNYESATCANPIDEPNYNTIIGAELKAKAFLDGGSDFMLVELHNNVPSSWNPYYIGWDRSGTGSSEGVTIHHPSGSIKKISTYTSTLVSDNPVVDGNTMADNSAWRVSWVETESGHGVTEGGSSGSPIFNQDHLIIGTLSGGSASCSSLSAPDYYGKLSYHWSSNGYDASEQIRIWLDPDLKGINTLSGKIFEEDILNGPDSLSLELSDDDITLNWKMPKENESGWYGFTSFSDANNIAGGYVIRGTQYSASNLGLIYPIKVSKLSHGFYNHENVPWTDDKFKFVIFDADFKTRLFESEELTAQHDNEYVYSLDSPLSLLNDFIVCIETVASDGSPSSLLEIVGTGKSHCYVNEDDSWIYAETGDGEGYEYLNSIYIEGVEAPLKMGSNSEVKPKFAKLVNDYQVENISGERSKSTAKENSIYGIVVYRNGEAISDTLDPKTTTFTDFDLAVNLYSYYVKAVYTPKGASKASNTAYIDMATIGIPSFNSAIEAQVIPNPNSGNFVLKLVSDFTGNFNYRIISVNGRIMEEGILHKTNRDMDISIQMSDVPQGLYFMDIFNSEQRITKKFLIEGFK